MIISQQHIVFYTAVILSERRRSESKDNSCIYALVFRAVHPEHAEWDRSREILLLAKEQDFSTRTSLKI